MNIAVPDEVHKILDKFEKAGFQIYIVGGAVRDALMKKTVYDWDFTTNANPEEILNLFNDAYYTNEFGTVGIPSNKDGGRPYEITTFRTEHGYSDARRPDKVEWGKTLEEDLKRRDFTINAMALCRSRTKKANNNKLKNKGPATTEDKERSAENTEVGKSTVKGQQSNVISNAPNVFQLIDPYGGQKDLKDRFIRAVGDANERFSEDALRMMRAVRIAAELNFKIEKETKEAILKNTDLINKIARERIRDELLKILGSPHPYQGMKLFREVGLMRKVLPEMEETFGVEQKSPGRHHIYDVGTHAMRSLKFVAERNSDPIVRLATLIHDIGKPQTFKKLDSGTITFYNHEVVGARIAKRISERLRFSKKQAEKLYKLVRWHQFSVDERQTDSAIRRFIRRIGIENVPDMLDLRVGDRLGGGARETSWRLEEYKQRLVEVQKQPFTVHDLKVSGHDIMEILNLNPGPKVGKILEKLYREVVNNKLPNEKEVLIDYLLEIKDKSLKR